jgi:thiol-disulfide isomerase/thioredoxin
MLRTGQALLLASLLMTRMATAAEGNPAPEFNLPLLGSETRVKLSDFRGRVVLLDFWASWCAPCRASFPAYESLRNRLQQTYGSDGFELIAINVDMEDQEAERFIAQNPVSFPVLREDSGGKTQQNYQLMAMPTSFLIDAQGIIRMQHAGFSQAYIALLESEAHQLLAPGSTD